MHDIADIETPDPVRLVKVSKQVPHVNLVKPSREVLVRDDRHDICLILWEKSGDHFFYNRLQFDGSLSKLGESDFFG